jgi:formate hydrogenlyase subunit 3/multisubunit Na+/H+ antiporter MnhD subunit
MTPELWVLGWLVFLLIGLLAAAWLDSLASRRSSGWLALWFGAGAVALMVMTFSLNPLTAQNLALPAPWSSLRLAPLPLAQLWSPVAGLLFLASDLALLSHPARRKILYALLPLEVSVGLYLWSGSGLMLLITWELISGLSYLGLVSVRRARPVWNAGWALLALSELGGMFLLLALAWVMPHAMSNLRDGFGALKFAAGTIKPWAINGIMVLALIAFGVKAGLFPVMVWIPMAEPEAPGVVAGIYSGLLTALAISGILALDNLTHPGITWGVVLLVLGTLGALTGALYGVISRHVKRILAYSTLEIMGLVFAALGVWHIETRLDPGNIAATMALDGAITLLVMHAGAKFTLFTATDFTGQWGHTLDRLGGLMRRAPWTGGWTLGAAVTLAAVPPLGGFLGEWFLLESILKPLSPGTPDKLTHLALVIAGVLIAIAVALGVATYLRWFAFIFLGPLHQTGWEDAAEPKASFRYGLALPLILGFISGPGIPWFLPWLNRSLAFILSTPGNVLADTFVNPHAAPPLIPIGVNLVPAPGASGTVLFPQAFSVGDPYVLLGMGIVLVGLVWLLRQWARHGRKVRRVAPWTGGFEPYSGKTSFSAEGFVHPIRLAFGAFYGLKRSRVDVEGVRFYRHTIVYRLEEHLYRPILVTARWVAGYLRQIQSGRVTQYVAYIWMALIVAIVVGVLNSH